MKFRLIFIAFFRFINFLVLNFFGNVKVLLIFYRNLNFFKNFYRFILIFNKKSIALRNFAGNLSLFECPKENTLLYQFPNLNNYLQSIYCLSIFPRKFIA